MTGSKKWYLSKAIWGAIILLVSTILGFFGYTITAGDGGIITNISKISERNPFIAPLMISKECNGIASGAGGGGGGGNTRGGGKYGSGGGGGGGGTIVMFYNTLTNSGTIEVNGGDFGSSNLNEDFTEPEVPSENGKIIKVQLLN
jgi:hypothetical protein